MRAETPSNLTDVVMLVKKFNFARLEETVILEPPALGD